MATGMYAQWLILNRITGRIECKRTSQLYDSNGCAGAKKTGNQLSTAKGHSEFTRSTVFAQLTRISRATTAHSTVCPFRKGMLESI